MLNTPMDLAAQGDETELISLLKKYGGRKGPRKQVFNETTCDNLQNVKRYWLVLNFVRRARIKTVIDSIILGVG